MRAFAVVVSLLSSCATSQPTRSVEEVPIASAAGSPDSATPPAPAPDRPKAATIESGGVGDVRLGRPIPPRHLSNIAEARARYEIRWVADAQPFEAFRIEEPPVIACFDGGPFQRWAKDNVGPLEPERFADEAIAFAKAGAPVTWIVIERPGPKTASGISVGSSWDDVVSAHPGAKIVRDPEWFEARPTCRASLAEVPGVEVLLSRCAGEVGDVTRVLVNRR